MQAWRNGAGDVGGCVACAPKVAGPYQPVTERSYRGDVNRPSLSGRLLAHGHGAKEGERGAVQYVEAEKDLFEGKKGRRTRRRRHDIPSAGDGS